jgi:hypothetical protein
VREIASRAAEAAQFRAQFIEAAEIAQTEGDRGKRDRDRVLNAYEDDENLRKLSVYFRFLGQTASLLQAIGNIAANVDDSKIAAIKVSDAATDSKKARESGVQPTPDGDLPEKSPASEATTGVGDGGPVRARAYRASRGERLGRIMRELAVLGPPIGDPSVTPLTRQEILFFEASEILGTWKPTSGDLAYLESQQNILPWGEIVVNILQGKQMETVVEAAKSLLSPVLLADGTMNSINVAKYYAYDLSTHGREIMNWRFPWQATRLNRLPPPPPYWRSPPRSWRPQRRS